MAREGWGYKELHGGGATRSYMGGRDGATRSYMAGEGWGYKDLHGG